MLQAVKRENNTQILRADVYSMGYVQNTASASLAVSVTDFREMAWAWTRGYLAPRLSWSSSLPPSLALSTLQYTSDLLNPINPYVQDLRGATNVSLWYPLLPGAMYNEIVIVAREVAQRLIYFVASLSTSLQTDILGRNGYGKDQKLIVGSLVQPSKQSFLSAHRSHISSYSDTSGNYGVQVDKIDHCRALLIRSHDRHSEYFFP